MEKERLSRAVALEMYDDLVELQEQRYDQRVDKLILAKELHKRTGGRSTVLKNIINKLSGKIFGDVQTIIDEDTHNEIVKSRYEMEPFLSNKRK